MPCSFTLWSFLHNLLLIYVIKASHHCLSEDFSQENDSVAVSWLLKNCTVWLHLCRHMCPCLSAHCLFFFIREESFPYTIVIAVWHVVPPFTIPEMTFCVGSETPTTPACGDQLPQGHTNVMSSAACPPQGGLSAALRIAHATSQIFRGYY